MRCPTCGQDADPANAYCPYCRAALHMPAAPSSPYSGGSPQGWTGQEYHQGYGPPEYGQHPERPGRSMMWLVVLIAVLVLLAGAGVAIWKLAGSKHLPVAGGTTHPSSAPASSAAGADGKTEAQTIDQLLNASSASRQKLGPALTAVDACNNVNGAITTLQQVTAERQNQVTQGQQLAVDQLSNGKQVQAALVAALTSSWQADQKYTAWAQGVAQNGCSGHAPHDANYTGAQAASGSATTAKQQFVSLWNPVAQAYGLPARSENTV